MKRTIAVAFTAVLVLASGAGSAQDGPDLRKAAADAMLKAATFFRTKLANQGGYVYYYAEDLSQTWGEGRASKTQIWVQPPGTPAVGLAFLKAYAATGEKYYLDGAVAAGEGLIHGQLESGGFMNHVDFDPAGKLTGKYRNGKGNPKGRNVSSLDDGQTQTAFQFLMELDRVLEFKHEKIHEAITYGMDRLLGAQFPNGAFPQGWSKAAEDHPIVKAKFPEYEWRTFEKGTYHKTYYKYYTLNDNLAGTASDMLITGWRVYKDEKFLNALKKLGDFLILAQMPDPQPGWCQQYNFEMIPIWARKFEPPAVTGGEGQDVMLALIKIFRETGDKKYLEPLPKAIEFYRKSLLPDGQLARYYELQTNKPIYMSSKYELTYDDSDTHKRYGWKRPSRLDAIEAELKLVESGGAAAAAPPRPLAELQAEVQKIVASLDDQGRWVSLHDGKKMIGGLEFKPDFRFIASAVFNRNLEVLSEFIVATK